MKNALLTAALSWIKPSIRLHPKTDQRRFLVVTTTALGDTLWATPALESLRKSFPSGFIGVLTSEIGMEVLKQNLHIDQLYLLKEPVLPRFLFLQQKLYAERFDTILVFHASQRLVLPLCSLLGAAMIVSTKGIHKGLDPLLTDPLPHLKEHEILRRLRMVEKAGGRIHSEKLSFFLTPEERLFPRKGRWIALHPGSKDAFKRWPAENFACVGRELKKRLSCEILITGTKTEKLLMETVAAAIPGARLADPNLSLRSFAALLDQMDLFICNDTGPFHLACALDIPAIGLYASTDPSLCGPHLAPHATPIEKKATCTPCLKRTCRFPFCFLQIGTEEVITAALNRMQHKSSV